MRKMAQQLWTLIQPPDVQLTALSERTEPQCEGTDTPTDRRKS